MLKATSASEALIHGFKGGQTTEVEQITSIDDVAEGDRKLKEFSVAKIKELVAGGKPFFLEHAFMKVHADNFASKEFKGRSASKYPYKDAVVEVDAYIGEIVKALDDAGVSTIPSSSSHPIMGLSGRLADTGYTRSAPTRHLPGKAACVCPASPTGAA